MATNCQTTTTTIQLYLKIFGDYLVFIKMPILEDSKQTVNFFTMNLH